MAYKRKPKTEEQKARYNKTARDRYAAQRAYREQLIAEGKLERPKPGRKPKPPETIPERLESRENYQRDWKRRNKEKLKEQFESRRQRARKFVCDIKANTPCADCGNKFHPVAMDFDHRSGEEKWGGRTGGVAKLVSIAAKQERIQEEIDKCDLVCANCHRIRTHEQNGWYEHG